ncbi:DNA mismatch repair protein MutS [Chloroflexia bacterium SDU3-3]|nr:DNA mismatch repair protein MutS [Chloroflexia bacterium SDU3-3]
MATAPDRRALQRRLDDEFPDLQLLNWYIQYRQLKAGCPDAVLLYRMGDFYETFDDDAKLVAEKLEITLTYKKFANNKATGAEQRCPMAGLPYHAAERYTSQLVSAGYRVAIAEQISETPSSRKDTRPKSVFAGGIEAGEARKGMVDREVVRILTPGTITETTMLPAVQNNYLVAVIAEGGKVGLAYADLSTGEFACTEFAGDRAHAQAQGELARLSAAELLVPEDEKLRIPGLDPASARLEHDLEFMTKGEREMLLPGERLARRTERENNARWAHGHVTGVPAWKWDLRTTYDALTQQFGVRSLDGFGLSAEKKLAIRAAGAILQYTRETQNGALVHMTSLRAYTTSDVMFLDPQTRRNLELLEGSGGRSKGSLVQVLDQTRTPMGARLLRRWIGQPLLDVAQLTSRQENVGFFVENALLRADMRERLKALGDMERAVNRVAQGGGVAVPRDLVRLREALRALPATIEALGGWRPAGMAAPVAAPEQDAQGEPELGGEWDMLFDEEPPTPEPPAPEPPTPEPSLREQREARRKVAARYAEQEDLFADFDWGADEDEEPLPEPPAPEPEPPAPERRALPRPRRSAAPSPSGIDACADVLAFLEGALDDDPPALLGASNYLRAVAGGETPRRVIRPGFDKGMDEVVKAARTAQQYISNLEAREQQKTGIKSLRVGYNQVFGYYIEVAKSYAGDVPADYIRKQTLSTGERYYTSELKEFENIVITAQERLNDLERQAFARVCAIAAEAGERLLATARALAEIDVYLALAEVAARGGYTRPLLAEDSRLIIQAGRHPMVEQALDDPFIPNDALLDTDANQILVITGPNMAGKSTVLRQIALIVLMAQIGSFVPAERAEIGLVDRIFTRIGAQDDIATGQSTFMVEMTETAALLIQSTRRSLIILDEVGRGTSTYDGMAIAQAVIEYIHNEPRLGCRTLFATHYHELTRLEHVLPRVKNYHMAAVEQDGHVAFLHKLRSGGADRSYGIHVAELAGIPRAVTKRAKELLADLEQSTAQPAPAPQAEGAAPEAAPEGLHPAVEFIRRLQVNELTPIEALTKLYELQQLARQ